MRTIRFDVKGAAPVAFTGRWTRVPSGTTGVRFETLGVRAAFALVVGGPESCGHGGGIRAASGVSSLAAMDVRPVRFRLLLAAQILLILAYPYARETPFELGLLLGLANLVLLAGLFAANESHRSLALGVVLAGPAAVAKIGATAGVAVELLVWGNLLEAAFYGFVIFEVSRSVFRERHVTSDTLAGAVCIYFLLALAWSSLYTLIELTRPGSFHFPGAGHVHEAVWPELLFFSFTALTTVGYGDITPLTSQARSLASLESAAGVLYTAILVARLVGTRSFADEG